MQLTNKQTYFYQIEALRSAMLLLGPVLHAGLSFMVFPLGDAWTYKHSNNSEFFDTLVLFIHTFRVPVFFVLAGFFMEKNIEEKLLINILIKKLKRIGIPLILGVLILFPFIEIGLERAIHKDFSIIYYMNHFDASNYGTIHLWFLYYLLFFYVGHLLISNKLKGLRKLLKQINSHYLGIIVVVFMIYALLILNFVNTRSYDGDYHFIPNIGSILYFLGFYFLGVLFFHIEDLFSIIRKQYTIYFLIGFIAFGILLYTRNKVSDMSADFSLFENTLFVIIAYTFVIGLFGLFSKYFLKKHKIISYISNSAYFVYVVHLPILTLLLSVVTNWKLSSYSLFSLLIIFTLTLSYGLYEIIKKLKIL